MTGSLSLHLWLNGGGNLNVTTQTEPITAPLDLSFDNDMLENFETVFAIHFEAQRNDFIFFSE